MGERDFIKWEKKKKIPKGVFLTPYRRVAIDYALMWMDDVEKRRISGRKQVPIFFKIELKDGEYEGTWKDVRHFGETELLKDISILRVVEVTIIEPQGEAK